MAAALPASFLEPLLSTSLMEDGELRQLVLEILHNILDRHDNRAKLRGIRWPPPPPPLVSSAGLLRLTANVLQDHPQRGGAEDQTGEDLQAGRGLHEEGSGLWSPPPTPTPDP